MLVLLISQQGGRYVVEYKATFCPAGNKNDAWKVAGGTSGLDLLFKGSHVLETNGMREYWRVCLSFNCHLTGRVCLIALPGSLELG